VLAGPYPEVAGHTTRDECGEAEGNKFNGCKADTMEKANWSRLGGSRKAAKALKERPATQVMKGAMPPAMIEDAMAGASRSSFRRGVRKEKSSLIEGWGAFVGWTSGEWVGCGQGRGRVISTPGLPPSAAQATGKVASQTQ